MSNHNNKKSIFIIIPAYNESEIIKEVVKGVLDLGYSVLVVDDGSAIPVKTLLHDLPVYLLRHKVNLGQGAALQTGFEFALQKNASLIVTFDADGQHDPTDIGKLLPPIHDRKADVVLGSRFINDTAENIPSGRRTAIQFARFVNYLFTGLLLTDAHNGMRAMNKEAAAKINLQENRMAHATEIITQIRKHKLKFCEVPVTIRYTEYESKKGQRITHGFRIFFDILLNTHRLNINL